jgi:hypothetical protein
VLLEIDKDHDNRDIAACLNEASQTITMAPARRIRFETDIVWLWQMASATANI